MPEEPPFFEEIDGRIEDKKDFSPEQKMEFKNFLREYYNEIHFDTGDVRLDQLSVENFRTIDKTKIDLNRLDTILFGQNSMGKTSLVKAILYNIAGLPESPSAFDMTRLIKTDKKILNTVGYWTTDDTPQTLERSLRQSGQGSSLSGDQEPYLSKDHTTSTSISGRYTDPSEVLATFGLQELKQRGHDPYETLSLFFLMSEDFTRFLGESHSELMDLLFGVNITTVMTAIDNKLKNLELSDTEDRSIQTLRKFQSRQEELEPKLENAQRKQESKLSELKDKQDRLNSLDETLSGQNQLDRLRRRKSELEGRKADLKVQKSEVVENLASVRRTIERYEDTELVDDMSGMADELRNFMTIPNRCPVCTNEVDTEQRKALVHDSMCPLCEKDMPHDRYRTEVEYQKSDDVTDDDSTHHEQSLDDLHNKRRKLEGEKQSLDKQITRVEQEISDVTKDIQENKLSDLAEEQDQLQKDVRSLRDEVVDLDVKIDSLKEQLMRISHEIKANTHLKQIAQRKDDRRKAYERFKSIVEDSRSKQRKRIKRHISEEMEQLFQYFTQGTLENAREVFFKSGGSYHFMIRTSERDLDSSVADESTAEINLHALLFHTAVLKLLSKKVNSLPLRLFVIDSPFANEVDEQNTNDLENFLISLPQILPEYQIIIASADTDSFDPANYSSAYSLIHFG